jgi:hypothetical protein
MRAKTVVVGLILTAICAVALDRSVRATSGLPWPGGSDFARDIASAETIAAGHLLSDPYYRGEWNWYNPLAPSIVAVVSMITRWPIPFVYAHIGAYLNLLVPLALFAVVTMWWGSLTGLAAVIALVFLVPGPEPGWLSASYSPWLLPMHLGQSVFYAGLIAVARAWQESTRTAFCLAGVSIGMALLTHTAPALLLAICMTVEFARTGWPGRERLIQLLIVVLSASIVATPYLLSIGGHYHFHIRNAAPIAFVTTELDLEHVRSYWVATLSPSLIGVIALIGYVWLARQWHTLPARLILSSAIASAIFLGFSYVAQTEWGRANGFHGIVPPHHFVYYLRAFEAFAFAAGVTGLADWIGRALRSRAPFAADAAMPVLVSAAIGLAVWTYPSYARRFDFVGKRIIAQRMFTDHSLVDMYEWLRRNTAPDDVVLAPLNLSQSVIGTSGRKVVAVDKLFSNPYVDWAERARDRDEMEHLLEAHDWTDFLNLAARYRVRYVAHHGLLSVGNQTTPLLTLAWHESDWTIYRTGPALR